MDKIKILENTKSEYDYIIRLEFAIPIPASLSPLNNKIDILNSFKTIYPSLFGLVDNDVIYRTSLVFPYTTTESEIKQAIEATYNFFQTKLNETTVFPCDSLIGATWDGVNWI